MSAEPSPNSLLVLNPNILLTPCSDFPEDDRARLGGGEDDVVVGERRSRFSAQRVSAETARFLRRFGSPTRILDAVRAHAAEAGDDPVELLDLVFPLLTQLRAQRILIAPEDARPVATEPRFRPADQIDGLEILRCAASQAETEIYAVRLPDGRQAALKWVPREAPDFVRAALAAEERILRRLEQSGMPATPRALGSRAVGEEGAYLPLTWFEGRTLDRLALAPDLDLVARAQIAAQIARLYARLHGLGVLHGDVHAGNILVDPESGPALIDFGCARALDEADSRPRAGLLTDYEPEAARELLADGPLPLATPEGEQYCVASMLYRLVAGAPPLRLSLEGRVALRQIAEQPPRAFADAGLYWPDLEATLRRALAKNPSDRHPGMAEFAEALDRIAAHGPPPAPPAPAILAGAGDASGRDALRALLANYGLDSALLDAGLRRGPVASLYHGGAGVAYALLRAAVLMEDPEALAAADLWIEQAHAAIPGGAAFDGTDLGIDPADISPAALFHRAPGVHAVRALIRHAAGDEQGFETACRAFLSETDAVSALFRSVSPPDRFALDMMNGPASHLLGIALLHPAAALCGGTIASDLAARADSLAATVLADATAWSAADPVGEQPYVGLAHGFAGALFALCRWSLVGRAPVPPALDAALDRLAGLAVESPDGLSWPVERGPQPFTPWTGWCHGSAGHALLWSLAAELRGREDDRYRARATARHLWANRHRTGPTLCCGLAGEALSLATVGSLAGDPVVVDQGRTLLADARAARFDPVVPHSLFRGGLGIELAALELARPDQSVWPLCGNPV